MQPPAALGRTATNVAYQVTTTGDAASTDFRMHMHKDGATLPLPRTPPSSTQQPPPLPPPPFPRRRHVRCPASLFSWSRAQRQC